MTKTPDEFKKAMAYCIEPYCPGEKCPYYHAESCAQDKTYDALAYIQHLESLVPRWIPVEERLPEPFKAVLVYCPEHKNIYEVYMDLNGVWRFFDYGIGKQTEPATHWMPLPKSPGEVQHEP